MMMLELHVWGPAFGLPSIDPESLAAIAFITQTAPRDQYQFIQSSPSAVPTHQLPTLYNPNSQTYHSGYPSITSHLLSLYPPSSPPSRKTAADSTAYSAFLTAHAAPLLALSLYVSSTNWSSTVRPAYSKILPFPLGWTEPPAIRAAMSRRAAHLGMSSLDTDATAEREEAEREAAVAQGWVNLPKGLGKGVGGALAPEQRARIRLEGLAGEVLGVLGEVEWKEEEVGTRCLAWAYLALMMVPDVPRGWLGETIKGKYARLGDFVDGGLGEPWRRWWARRKLKVTGRVDALQEESGELWRMAGMGVALVVSALLWKKLPQLGEPVQIWQKPLSGFLGLGAAGIMLGHLAETTVVDHWR
ncbi:Tom37 C-terminal domain-containing protein [Cercophora newfieldiana]|uniref:Tom37 C-terminal domain-containing protein n=1 Tax=Cercophora newfieldiana TaxID=92897 RepID=A0AA39YSC7_9PEZI|nr:Tom37 C-terminal domain-containing protein [Cercophora newfieldiana]